MPDGDEPEHPGLHVWWWNKIVVLLKNLASLCFLYDIFLTGPTAEERMAPYKDLLDNTSNLQKVVTVLKSMIMNDGRIGYDAVLRTLINYDPDLGWQSQERLFDCRMKTKTIADKTFLVRVVHILWMEMNAQLPWSIKDYTEEEIKGLFFEYFTSISGTLCPAVPSGSMWDGSFENFREPLICLEASYKLHAIALKLKATATEQSVINCIRFIKSNFFHPYTDSHGSYSLDRYSGGKQFDPDTCCCPPNLGRLFEERIAGCHSPSVVFSELLRLLNIPAFPVLFAGHGVTYIPGLDRFVHGDHLVCLPLYPSALLLLTPAEMAEYKYDSMMWPTVYIKLRMVVNEESANRMSTTLKRIDSNLVLPIIWGWEPSADVISMIEQELPQYHIRYDPSWDCIFSQFVPIRSLEDFSAPGSDLWY